MVPGILGVILNAAKGRFTSFVLLYRFLYFAEQMIYKELFVLFSPEIPVEARSEMGRKEGDYDWKKSTDNIQDVFEFMEVLGS